MSADPARALVGLLLLLSGSAVLAQEEELPDADFLEYLGSWEESDEEWLLFQDNDQVARQDAGSDMDEDESEGKGKDNES